ncbi:MAG: septum formation initiator family protein [Euryarchaeota archaeon]|nr:septum formation initiator family protein [Euryarchaeota archaeon]
MHVRTFIGLLALVAIVGLTPSAIAHATAPTDDGRFFITVGNQNEPVTTWTKTGLDLIIRENESGERGAEVPDLHRTLSATLISPGGEEMRMDLKTQFREVGRYEFTEPYVLTEAGQYRLRLVGEIDVTTVDGIYDVSRPVPSWSEITFPAEAKTPTELEAENDALRQEIDDLEARLSTLESDQAALQEQVDAQETNEATALPSVLAVLGIAGLIAIARRR